MSPDRADVADVDDDPTELARIFVDPTRSEIDRNDAAARLLPFLERIARGAVSRFGPRGRELVGDLVSVVTRLLLEGRWDCTRDLEPWVRGVMRHLVPDELDPRRNPRARVESLALPECVLDARPVSDGSHAEPFGEADAQAVRSWPLLVRLVVLARGLLWRKVCPEEWETWVEEGGAELPFPDPDIEHWALRQRISHVADRLGQTRYVVNQIWHRAQERLRALRYVQELRHDV